MMFLYHVSIVSMLQLWTLAVLTTSEPVCDRKTQYQYTGECCQKCEPGTRTAAVDECTRPMCRDCSNINEYNSIGLMCCLDNNFKWPERTSKTKPKQCWCKEGFHCSSASCTTCVPHTECTPGYGVTITGDQVRDTVCEQCPDGTFSDERSWKSPCQQKTKCRAGTQPQGGSSVSDHECVKDYSMTLILGVVLSVLAVVKVACLSYIFCKKGNPPLTSPNGTEARDDANRALAEVATEDEDGKETLAISVR